MKEKVLYYTKCMKCGNIQEYIMRDKNINPTIKEDGVNLIIGNTIENPYTVNWCEKCNIHTLQMVVGWDY